MLAASQPHILPLITILQFDSSASYDLLRYNEQYLDQLHKQPTSRATLHYFEIFNASVCSFLLLSLLEANYHQNLSVDYSSRHQQSQCPQSLSRPALAHHQPGHFLQSRQSESLATSLSSFRTKKLPRSNPQHASLSIETDL